MADRTVLPASSALEKVQRLLNFPKASLSETLLQPRFCDGLVKLYAPYVKAAAAGGDVSSVYRDHAGAVMDFVGELAKFVVPDAAPKSMQGVIQQSARAVFVAVLQTVHAKLADMSSQKQLHNSMEDILAAVEGLTKLSAPAAMWTKAFTTEGAGNKATLLDTIVAKMCDNLQSGFLTVFAVEILYHLHACEHLTRSVASCVGAAVPKQHLKRLRALLRVSAGEFMDSALAFARATVSDLCAASTTTTVEVIVSGDKVQPVSLRSNLTAAGTAELSLFLLGADAHPVVSVPVGAIHRPHLVEATSKAPMKLVFSTDAAPVLNAANADDDVVEVDVTLIFAKGASDTARQLALACGCAARGSTREAAEPPQSGIADENTPTAASRNSASSPAAVRAVTKKAPLTPTETAQPKAIVAATAPKKITAAMKAALAPASATTTTTTATTAAAGKKTTTAVAKKSAGKSPKAMTKATAAPAATAAASPKATSKVTAKKTTQRAAKKASTAAPTAATNLNAASAEDLAMATVKAATTGNAASQPSATQKPADKGRAKPATEAVSATQAAVTHSSPTPAPQTRLVMRMLDSDDSDDDVSNSDGTSPEPKAAVAAPAPSGPAAAALVASARDAPEQRSLLSGGSDSDLSDDDDSSDDASVHDVRARTLHTTEGSTKHHAPPTTTTGTAGWLGQLSTKMIASTRQQCSFGQGATSPGEYSSSSSSSSSSGGGDGNDGGSTSTSTSCSPSDGCDSDNEDSQDFGSAWQPPPRSRGVSFADQFDNSIGLDGYVDCGALVERTRGAASDCKRLPQLVHVVAHVLIHRHVFTKAATTAGAETMSADHANDEATKQIRALHRIILESTQKADNIEYSTFEKAAHSSFAEGKAFVVRGHLRTAHHTHCTSHIHCTVPIHLARPAFALSRCAT